MNQDGLGGGYEGVHRKKESRVSHHDLLSPLGIGAESEERPQKVVCYTAGDKTGGVDMRERREFEDLKLAYALSWTTCFSGRLG